MQARTKRADGGRAMPKEGQRLRQQLHAGGLAVGTGDADHPHRFGGAIVETRSDFADLRMQVVDP